MTPARTALLISALMLGTFLAALDSTVVNTAMPTIIGKLGGVALYSWVFSAYLLTSTTTVPVYGKLADLYGRKPVFLAGVTIFLSGSVLCGLAQSMVQLIVFRAIQGIGAGAVLPITITIIGDTFSIEQRARFNAFFSGVWGVSSVVGPIIGAFLTETVGWRWVFFLNLPFGLLAMGLITVLLTEHVAHRRHQIDYLGSTTLTLGVTALLLALLQGGEGWAWSSSASLATFATGFALLAVFFWQQTRAAEPVLPLGLFRNRIVAVTSAAGAVSGAVMFGVTSFVPLFAQGVQGGTARDAGKVLIPFSVAWALSAFIAGRMIVRTGYRRATWIGGTSLMLGGVSLVFINQGTSLALIAVLLFLIGAGMGFTNNAFIISLQNAVPWSLRGVATATNQFSRTMGGVVGVAIMGAVLNARWGAAHLGAGDAGRTSTLLDPERRGSLPTETLATMQNALAGALHGVFFAIAVAAVLVFIAVLFFPKGSAADLAAGGASATRAETAEPAPAVDAYA